MNEVTKEKLRTRLRQQGSSMTRSRLAIFEAFDGHSTLSMKQLVAKLPGLDRSTIYRNINLFEDLGIINRVQLGWKYKLELSDSFSPHHHHQTCTNCGEVTILDEDPVIEKRIHSIAGHDNFLAMDHQLEIRGLCSDCQPKT